MALRIAHLADSSFVAIRLGEVRRVIAASPRYLAQHPVIREPADLAKHQIISMTHFGLDSWSFPPLKGSSVPRTVQFAPRLVVNTVRAAVASAAEGHGVTRLFSYHIAEEIRDGPAADPARQGRRPAAARASARPAGPLLGAQGAGLRRLRRAPPQALFHPAVERCQPQYGGHSFATRKSVCRIAGIRTDPASVAYPRSSSAAIMPLH